jgi:hypothetical protein
MDGVLIAVTVVSLAVAVVASVVAWRASQTAKQHAAARVAALAAAAGVPLPGTPAREASVPADGLAAFTAEARPDLGPDTTTERLPGVVSVQASFLGASPEPVRESIRHQRWLMAGAALLAILLGGLVVIRMSGGGPTVAAAPSPAAPLELLSLRHEREGANLSVAGLIRNPPSAPVVEGISAVVFLFDQQGQFVTSARAPVDFLKLTAGDESPFVVKVAAPPSVARYRVSFRTDQGTLRHVDRRGDPPAAAPVSLTRQER